MDAVIIATPHFQHTTLGIAALEQRRSRDGRETDLLAQGRRGTAHRRAREISRSVVFAGMFQLRTEPRYLKIQKLIRDGDLGEIVRVNWINTDWFRTEAYYASGGWRATWKGEGGGVLLNQCLHNLDTLQWLCGMPARVRGFCQLGRFHQIEVEDNVTAYLEWPNGATGTFISSTGEAPGTNRFEIAGTKGRLVLENNQLAFTRNEMDMLEFSKTAKQGFVKPEVWNVRDSIRERHAAARRDGAEFCERHSRRRAAHCARRRGHSFGGIGERDGVFVVARENDGIADGRRRVGKQIEPIDRGIENREKSRGRVATDDFASSFRK